MNVHDHSVGASDQPFVPHYAAKTDKLQRLIDLIVGLVEVHEAQHQPRRKRRQPAAQAVFVNNVAVVVCGLVNHHLSDSAGSLYISRNDAVLRRRCRYRAHNYGRSFTAVVDALDALGFLVLDLVPPGTHRFKRKRSTIRPEQRLIHEIETYGITMEDLRCTKSSSGVETIVLKSAKDSTDYWDEAERIDYTDTTETEVLRREMAVINQWLAEGDIRCTDPTINAADRHLRRIFTQGRFDRGGRMFGGFWDSMSKAARFSTIRIYNERVVELDFSSMGPRQLYAWAGLPTPADDLYDIVGFHRHREGVKKVFASMVFKGTRPDKHKFPKETRSLFGGSHRCEDVVKAIEQKHEAIAGMFFSGKGHQVQFEESCILIEILLRLRAAGIIALPIHDALLVAASMAAETEEVMLDVFKATTGQAGKVTLDQGTRGFPLVDHS